MTDQQLQRLLILLRRPIVDPVPPWIRLDKEKIARFQDVQVKLNAKIMEIEEQKIKELTNMLGGAQEIIGK